MEDLQAIRRLRGGHMDGLETLMRRYQGYILGIGFVQPASLRVLAEPVRHTREGVTVTIEQVVADTERAVLV